MVLRNGAAYRIVNAKSNTSLDLSGSDHISLIGYNWQDSDNQKWVLHQQGGGWAILSPATGRALAFEGPLQDGTRVVGLERPATFEIFPDENNANAFRIRVPNTSFDVDLSDNGNPNPGTAVQLWSGWNPGVNQTWFFEPI